MIKSNDITHHVNSLKLKLIWIVHVMEKYFIKSKTIHDLKYIFFSSGFSWPKQGIYKNHSELTELFEIQGTSIFCVIPDILAKEANVIRVENKKTAIYSICTYWHMTKYKQKFQKNQQSNYNFKSLAKTHDNRFHTQKNW